MTPPDESAPAALAAPRYGVWRIVVVPALLWAAATLPLIGSPGRYEHAVHGMYALWAVWLLVASRRAGDPLDAWFATPRRETEWRLTRVAFPLLAVSFASVWLEVSLLATFIPAGVIEELLLDAGEPRTRSEVWLQALSAVVFAPPVEEWAFRGMLLRRWRARWGLPVAVFATSALFAVLHPVNLAGAFTLGVALAAISARTGSLAIPIATHALYNLFVTLLLAGPEAPEEAVDPARAVGEFQETWWVALVIMALALPFVVRFIRRTWPPETRSR